MTIHNKSFSIPNDWDRSGLPAWTYTSQELLEIEKEEIFRKHWQIVCHVSDVAEPGDFVTFDIVGERAIVMRGRDGVVRAFHNVCRHRGSRVVAEEKGTCKNAMVCPFHGWVFNLDGTLRGPARPDSLPPLDPVEHGLKPIEMEIWHGFVFIRFKPGPQGSVAALMARFEDEVAPYRPETLVGAEPIDWDQVSPVNWKSVRDVDNEGYHVAMAHPGLHDLYGKKYYDEPFVDGASRSFAPFNDDDGSLWSVRHYKSILPELDHLPQSHRNAWLYLSLFPNIVLGFYPDSVGFYQEFPIDANNTQLRGAIYRQPEEDRALRAARYLSQRIDSLTAEEDQMLTIWSNEATTSSGFEGIILSDLEYGVKTYHDHLRAVIPAFTLEDAPEPGTLAAENDRLLAERGE